MEELKHVYFFMNGEDKENIPPPAEPSAGHDPAVAAAMERLNLTVITSNPPALTDDTPTTARDSPSSPVSTASTAATVASSLPRCDTSSSNSSPLKASAPEFVPAAPTTPGPIAPWFELRPSPGKGLGMFAARKIPRGTRILVEQPLIRVVHNTLLGAVTQRSRLPADAKMAYDRLHFHCPDGMDLEQAARVHLLNMNGGLAGSGDFEKAVGELVRIMGIFAVNNFILSDGSLGVFVTGSRFNHSCIPNIHHTNNSDLRKETFHAVRDVHPGEELTINYLGAESYYQPQPQRVTRLREQYGFVCDCPSCTVAADPSNQRRELLSRILWGLNEYREGKPPNTFVPNSPQMALVQAEDAISFMMQEGIFTTELYKAYRIASEFALAIGEVPKAMEYALNGEEVEHNILGEEVKDLETQGIAAKQWVCHVYDTTNMANNGLGKAFWNHFPKRQQKLYKVFNKPTTSPSKKPYKKKQQRYATDA